MERDPRAFLWHAKDSADAIAEFVRGKMLDDYLADPMRRAAVERCFEVIGEALRQLQKVSPELAREIPELPRAIALRNILIHGYATIDHRRVWRTIEEDLPTLRERLSGMLDKLGKI